jgi:hypothetical protein
MKQILEAKLGSVSKSLNDAYNQCDQHGVTHYSAQEQLLLQLIDECNHQECCHDFYDDYYDDADEFYYDPLEQHYDELAWYKQEEMDNMYNTCNNFTRGLGQSVISLDSYWFTSDEIEAFREIWQRRLSA